MAKLSLAITTVIMLVGGMSAGGSSAGLGNTTTTACRPFVHELCPTGSRQTKKFYLMPYNICSVAACVEQHSV